MAISMHEINTADTWLAVLIKQVNAGDEIILTRHGKKMARLLPVQKEVSSEIKKSVIGWSACKNRLQSK